MAEEGLRGLWQAVQWERGLRTALVVGSAMVVCHIFDVPPAAAALGGFNALLVDNGGPYRTRLITMMTSLVGGSIAFVLGSILPADLAISVAAAMLFSFVIIFSRVLSQPLTSTSVLILVLYFAGVGGTQHTLRGALLTVAMLVAGGAWAMVLSLALWPVDPFRPARLAMANSYGSLADFTAQLGTGAPPDRETEVRAIHDWQRRQRLRMEEARAALAATAARAPSRTIRARNLTVLLETSDLLLARTVRLTELADVARQSHPADVSATLARLVDLTQWMAGAERALCAGLALKPADDGASFAREGSQRMEYITRRRAALDADAAALPAGDAVAPPAESLRHHLFSEERDALLEIEIAFDAVCAIWTGSEVQRIPWHSAAQGKAESSLQGDLPGDRGSWDLGWIDSGWRDALQANWTLESAMLRHALRVTVVAGVDVVAMRLIHINHGFWLPMTSIILLQPFSAGTARKSVQRVTGTIAGGILAAMLAAALPNQLWLMGVITVLAALTVATFAVDYAVYSFFLTPAFVLLSLPHLHDWRYAGIRIGTTLAGALVAVLAMRLLWPERAEVELGRLLRRGAEADAAYLRAMLRFWETPAKARRSVERQVLAPARRACGLASNDAEEAVDRVMQEPQFGRMAAAEVRLRSEALTFATYLRRLTQSITTLAVVGRDTPLTHTRMERLIARLERIAQLAAEPNRESGGETLRKTLRPYTGPALVSVAEEQMQRLERQVEILERASEAIRA